MIKNIAKVMIENNNKYFFFFYWLSLNFSIQSILSN